MKKAPYAKALATCLVALSPTIAAAADRARKPAPVPEAVNVSAMRFGGTSKEITTAKCYPSPVKTKVIRIKVGVGAGGLVVKSPKRDVYVADFSTTEADEEVDENGGTAQPQPDVTSPAHSPTKFDIDVYNLLNGGGSKVVMIKVKLMDQALSFPDGVGQFGKNSVRASDDYGSSMFCNLGKIKSKSDNGIYRQSVRFWAKDPGTKATGSFNIHLIVTDDGGDFTLPVIIDPNVKNEG